MAKSASFFTIMRFPTWTLPYPRRCHTSQGRNYTPIRTAATTEGVCSGPLEAAEVENADLLDVFIRTVLTSHHDHVRTSGPI